MQITDPRELNAQHDAAECLQALLRIHSFGYLWHEIQECMICTNCRNESYNHVRMSVAPIEIPYNSILDYNDTFLGKDAIQSYYQSIEGEVEKNCDDCEASTCTKTVTLVGVPNFIIIQFIRFRSELEFGQQIQSKISNKSEPFSYVDIQTPHELTNYEVIATIEYQGQTMRGGHYISYL